MKLVGAMILASMVLCGCGGGGGDPDGAAIATGFVSGPLPPSSSLAQQCAAPRPFGTVDPQTGQPYNDVQGSLSGEMAWVVSYVNETYLWYSEVPAISSSPYAVGAAVAFIEPSNNVHKTVTPSTNHQVVDAYFNSQRTLQTTVSGKPKDRFHFTYLTTDWQALASAGNEVGFGFQITMVAATPPRQAMVAYTEAGTPAVQNNLVRGAQILTVDGIDVANGTDIAALNEGLFSPIAGKSYTFQVQDPGSVATRSVTMTAAGVTLTPVPSVGTLPAPNASVGYLLFNEHIATAERGLIAAVNQLKAANGGAGVSDLVLDIRYNGGGYLDIASELAYMIAGPGATSGKVFERATFNDKNPFSQTVTPFHAVTQGFSAARGQSLPQLGLSTVYVITGSGTCSASEAVINGLRGAGINVIQIGGTTCGKPYGFYPKDNCGTTYFTIQFKGVNHLGYGDYTDGFVPAGSGADHLPGCLVADDFTKPLGDPDEGRLAAALQYRGNGSCPPPPVSLQSNLLRAVQADSGPALQPPGMRNNRILRPEPAR